MGDDEPEEPEHRHEVDVPSEPEVKISAAMPVHSKDTEKQLSKKELKKKELAELDAVLAELGISENATKVDVTSKSERKAGEQNGDWDKNGLPVPPESKNSKKKKLKKDKPTKDSKEQPNEVDSSKDHGEAADTKSDEEATAVDVKEKMKKIAAAKKKKSSKEVDAAAKHAAIEAAARSAKLAAAKKKEKNHYNQQPVR
ncbi:hypothetical protein BRADI_3g07897v3 [Brachypodium distachyon]|nr:hypothetical protein BRADI_3g07897v3 [Brachypodium distachyon]